MPNITKGYPNRTYPRVPVATRRYYIRTRTGEPLDGPYSAKEAEAKARGWSRDRSNVHQTAEVVLLSNPAVYRQYFQYLVVSLHVSGKMVSQGRVVTR